MPSEALYTAVTDQFRALVSELASVASVHIADCPQPHLDCPGAHVQDTLKRVTHRELLTFAEVAIVAIARRPAPSTYRETFVCWVRDEDDDEYPFSHAHSGGDCDWGWICSQCTNRVDEQPCPDHAPTSVPGLRLVECQATPRHWLFVHDRDDYGHGCPWCWADRATAELSPLKEAAERHAHRWCWLSGRLKRLAVTAKVARFSSCLDFDHACHHVTIKWRRP